MRLIIYLFLFALFVPSVILAGDGRSVCNPGEVSAQDVPGSDEGESLDEAIAHAQTLFDAAQAAEKAGDQKGAREKVIEMITLLETTDGAAEDSRAAGLMWETGFMSWRLGALQETLKGWRWAHGYRVATYPDDHHMVQTARRNLMMILLNTGDLAGARTVGLKAIAVYEATVDDADPDLQHARQLLAATFAYSQEYSRAADLFETVVRNLEKTVPEDHPKLLEARQGYAAILVQLKRQREASVILEKLVEILERKPEENFQNLQMTRLTLSSALKDMGEFERASELALGVVEGYKKIYPENHPHLLTAQINLGILWRLTGELEKARELQEQVLGMLEQLLPEGHTNLLAARINVAQTLMEIGDLAKSRAIYEKTITSVENSPQKNHNALWAARSGLSALLNMMGDLAGARAIMENQLAEQKKILPENHPDLLATRLNLGIDMYRMGDFPGARSALDEVIKAMESSPEENADELVLARAAQSMTLWAMAEHEQALALGERVLAHRQETLDGDHPDLQSTRLNLALILKSMDRLERAGALEQKALAALARKLPHDHIEVLLAKMNHGGTLYSAGRLDEARATWDEAMAGLEGLLPDGHPHILEIYQNYVWLLAAQGDRELLAQCLEKMCNHLEAWIADCSMLSPREVRETADKTFENLSSLLSLVEEQDGESVIRRKTFSLIESVRAVTSFTAQAALERSDDLQARSLREKALSLRVQLNDMVYRLRETDPTKRPSGDDLAQAIRARDEAESKLRKRTGELGITPLEVDPDELAAVLPPRSAAVGYRVYKRSSFELGKGGKAKAILSMLAHVVDRRGSVELVELGPVDRIEAAVEEWRKAIDETRNHGRRSLADAGSLLRALVVDPVLKKTGEATRLYVCSDGAVQLVPLDALRLEGGYVGDLYEICNEVSFTRLLTSKKRPPRKKGNFVAVGGVEYDAATEQSPALMAAAAPPLARTHDGGDRHAFSPLSATRSEAEELASLFESHHENEAIVLTDGAATKSALFHRSPGARYLHLATHGYFADTLIEMTAESTTPVISGGFMGAAETVRGMAPLTLCGLALSGANRGCDSLGRVSGIITAEEIAGLDLSGCELAVLSACETNVGVQRSGQGILSLQRALVMAGARGSITSLWKVDDQATRIFFLEFYRTMWEDGVPPRQALNTTKKWLRNLPQESVIERLADHRDVAGRGEVRKRQIIDPPAGKCPYSAPYYWAAFVYWGEGD